MFFFEYRNTRKQHRRETKRKIILAGSRLFDFNINNRTLIVLKIPNSYKLSKNRSSDRQQVSEIN